ncbi:MAG: hypothetical protein ACOY5U_09410 [Pseudomonadota bacterium]
MRNFKLLAAAVLATLARALSGNAEFTAELSYRLAEAACRLRADAEQERD